jgi:hypothetical protein
VAHEPWRMSCVVTCVTARSIRMFAGRIAARRCRWAVQAKSYRTSAPSPWEPGWTGLVARVYCKTLALM